MEIRTVQNATKNSFKDRFYYVKNDPSAVALIKHFMQMLYWGKHAVFSLVELIPTTSLFCNYRIERAGVLLDQREELPAKTSKEFLRLRTFQVGVEADDVVTCYTNSIKA